MIGLASSIAAAKSPLMTPISAMRRMPAHPMNLDQSPMRVEAEVSSLSTDGGIASIAHEASPLRHEARQPP